jgi:hypothetical protein
LKLAVQFAPPEFEGAGRDEFEIIRVRVNGKNLHAWVIAEKRPGSDSKSQSTWRRR